MPGDRYEAARVARDAATSQNADYLELSALMCWDGVVRCAEKSGLAAGTISGITGDNYAHFVPLNSRVNDAAAMRAVEQGAFIGFFDGNTLVHAMMAVGHGNAAGNKNACIGIGRPVGWEILSLGDDGNWNGAGFGPRNLSVFYRTGW